MSSKLEYVYIAAWQKEFLQTLVDKGFAESIYDYEKSQYSGNAIEFCIKVCQRISSKFGFDALATLDFKKDGSGLQWVTDGSLPKVLGGAYYCKYQANGFPDEIFKEKLFIDANGIWQTPYGKVLEWLDES